MTSDDSLLAGTYVLYETDNPDIQVSGLFCHQGVESEAERRQLKEGNIQQRTLSSIELQNFAALAGMYEVMLYGRGYPCSFH